MRIRFVTPPPSKRIGGIENAVEGLREALEKQGIEVIQGGDPSDAESIHHFHGLWDPSFSRMAARLRKFGRPYVVSPHGMLEPWAFRHRRWKKLPYFWLLERRFLLGAKSLFVTSKMEAEHLRRIIEHPLVEILPLGCRDRRGPDFDEARQRLGWRDNERVFLFLSRIDVKKGLHMLLEALAQSHRDWSDWRLVIVGDGDPHYVMSLKKTAETVASRLPVVDWVGPVWGDRRWPYLQGADLFCLPTHSENFGIAVLEALHAGTPVLTTTGTPWKDFADTNGIFICDATTTSIHDCLEMATVKIGSGWHEFDRNRLAEWAESHFSWSILVEEYVKAYERGQAKQ